MLISPPLDGRPYQRIYFHKHKIRPMVWAIKKCPRYCHLNIIWLRNLKRKLCEIFLHRPLCCSLLPSLYLLFTTKLLLCLPHVRWGWGTHLPQLCCYFSGGIRISTGWSIISLMQSFLLHETHSTAEQMVSTQFIWKYMLQLFGRASFSFPVFIFNTCRYSVYMILLVGW